MPGRYPADLPPPGRPLRSHARRKLLSRHAAGRGRGTASPGHRPREPGGRLRVPRRPAGADDRAEAGRGVPLCHDRPGHDPLSHGAMAARRHPVRRRSPPGSALPAAFRHGPPAGLRQGRVAARQLRHRAGQGRPAVQDPRRRHRGAGRPARTKRSSAPPGSSRRTTTPSPTGPSFRPTSGPAWPRRSASGP